MRISVLMSTYCREKHEYLDEAMKSIWTEQTRKPDQIVLVEDGPLTPQLYEVIDTWRKKLGDVLTLVENKQNLGLAESLNKGIKECSGELIARMDSDDRSAPARFLLQEKYMTEHPEVDILGGSLEEFNDEGSLSNVRRYPLQMKDVVTTMYKASPLGHPSVMFRRSFFESGYKYSNKYYICEDVSLWFDAAKGGRVINNIPDIVLYFRRNDSMLMRRGKEKAWSEFLAYSEGIRKLYGVVTLKYVYPLMRMAFRLMPTSVIRAVYNSGFRKKVVK